LNQLLASSHGILYYFLADYRNGNETLEDSFIVKYIFSHYVSFQQQLWML